MLVALKEAVGPAYEAPDGAYVYVHTFIHAIKIIHTFLHIIRQGISMMTDIINRCVCVCTYIHTYICIHSMRTHSFF